MLFTLSEIVVCSFPEAVAMTLLSPPACFRLLHNILGQALNLII